MCPGGPSSSADRIRPKDNERAYISTGGDDLVDDDEGCGPLGMPGAHPAMIAPSMTSFDIRHISNMKFDKQTQHMFRGLRGFANAGSCKLQLLTLWIVLKQLWAS